MQFDRCPLADLGTYECRRLVARPPPSLGLIPHHGRPIQRFAIQHRSLIFEGNVGHSDSEKRSRYRTMSSPADENWL
jgi:hypothetical protein